MRRVRRLVRTGRAVPDRDRISEKENPQRRSTERVREPRLLNQMEGCPGLTYRSADSCQRSHHTFTYLTLSQRNSRYIAEYRNRKILRIGFDGFFLSLFVLMQL